MAEITPPTRTPNPTIESRGSSPPAEGSSSAALFEASGRLAFTTGGGSREPVVCGFGEPVVPWVPDPFVPEAGAVFAPGTNVVKCTTASEPVMGV